jgi:hypothetical protein
MKYRISVEDGNVVVYKNEQLLKLPKSDGTEFVPTFDSIEDAEMYLLYVKACS